MTLIYENNLNIIFNKKYLSFEYLLLKSNMIADDIDNFIEKYRLKFYSLEDLCTKRLIELTRETFYSYSKSATDFSPCYYVDCCSNQNNDGSCKLRRTKVSQNKVIEMIRNTDFEYILYLKK